jgi:hypothetical protein
MKKRFRIIKEGYADKYGDVNKFHYYIKEYKLIFWLFYLIPLPISYGKWINDGNKPWTSRIRFNTFKDAELFTETVLERNKPRSKVISTIEKEISC